MTTAKEKVAVIGGSSGIGLAAAQRLAAEGFSVVVSARTRERVEAAVKTIGAGVSGHVLDYGNRQGIAAFFKAMGSFDHLVLAAAGPAAWGAFGELKAETLEGAFQSKFWGYFHSLQTALPQLRSDGSITLVSGAAARAAIPGTAGLAAVNGAIERMGMTLARELAPRQCAFARPRGHPGLRRHAGGAEDGDAARKRRAAAAAALRPTGRHRRSRAVPRARAIHHRRGAGRGRRRATGLTGTTASRPAPSPT